MRDGSVVDGARYGDHSETAVLDLVCLVFCHLFRALAHTEWVEEEVSWFTVGLSVDHLNGCWQGHDFEE